MAGSPLVVDYMLVTVTTSLPDAHYARGMEGLFVYGYCQFITNGFSEEPRFINFKKMMFFPRNRRFDTFKWQCKPGCSVVIKPVYGNLDIINPEVLGQAINVAGGLVKGLRVYTPEGIAGPDPVLIPPIP